MTLSKVKIVPYPGDEAAAWLTESLKETGFAVLRDHPIPADLIVSAYEQWQGFFEGEDKYDYPFSKDDQDGYFPFVTEHAKDGRVMDLKEFYHVYPWWRIPAALREVTMTLFRRLEDLATELLGWISSNVPLEISQGFSMPLDEMIQTAPQPCCDRSITRPRRGMRFRAPSAQQPTRIST